jgi:hypothetical protein
VFSSLIYPTHRKEGLKGKKIREKGKKYERENEKGNIKKTMNINILMIKTIIRIAKQVK